MAAANMKDVKRRIKSVESTMQITKAMQLVASSKMRRAKEKAEAVHPFFETLVDTMCRICSDKSFSSIFTRKRASQAALVIVIAGDRGLAGGFNSNVLKSAEETINKFRTDGIKVKVMAIGKKSVEYFEKRDYEMLGRYPQIAEGLDVYDTVDIAELIIDGFKAQDFDSVSLVYTTFVSAMTQEPCSLQILPVENFHGLGETMKKSAVEYDPSPEEVFDGMIPQYMCGVLYSAIVDSFAAEQAARRTAMESASDNANEMIDKLSLMYNRARQAQITQEITEISSAQIDN